MDYNGIDEAYEKALRREIHMARNIQTTLLNGEKPELHSGEVSGISVPARLIGGDYFDFYPLENGKLRIIIGDVMGKGIPAAMLMILTRGAFRSTAESALSPCETLSAMNNALHKDLRKLRSFVTVFCADWDPYERTFTYANAGHNLPIILKRNSVAVHPPEVKGIMLGGLPNQKYQEKEVRLEEDDMVFFYTDGIVEAQNPQGDMFKLERLIQVLADNVHVQVYQIEQAVLDAVNEFVQGMQQRDDITMVILKTGQADSSIRGKKSPVLIP